MYFLRKLFEKKSNSKQETIRPSYIDELNSKYFRNLGLMVDYDILIDCYCDIFETWENKPLNSNLTYKETHNTIKHILEKEYCEEICDKIKEGNFTEGEVKKIIVELDVQYNIYKNEFEYTKTIEGDLLEKFKKGEL